MVDLYVSDANHVVVVNSAGVDAYGLLMPARSGYTEVLQPFWREKEQAVEAAA
jgi:hypothetical protein